MVDFSSMPAMRGYYAPCRFDADLFDCEVTGTLPADLRGAFYRIHLDWFYPPSFRDEASLSADGYISSVPLQGRRASTIAAGTSAPRGSRRNVRRAASSTAIIAIRSPTMPRCAIRSIPGAAAPPTPPR